MENEPWSEFLNQINSLFKSDTVVLLVVPEQEQSDRYLLNRVVSTQNQPAGSINHWITRDPFSDIPMNTPIRLNELGIVNNPEGNEFLQQHKPNPISHILAINIPAMKTSGEISSDLLLKLRIGRTAQQGNFAAEDKKLLQGLVDHLKLALQFMDQLAIRQIERNALADAINQFKLGTLIVDRKGKIVASNRVARETIEYYRELTIQNGSLKIADKRCNQQLYAALTQIEQGTSDKPLMPRTITVTLDGSMVLGLMVRPVRPEDALTHPTHAHAVVFISDSQGMREISANSLQELFGFTGSEARVAAYLANGYTLNEAAEALSISINTTKSHARNIYEKTGVNKQTKFIQLVSNSVARVS